MDIFVIMSIAMIPLVPLAFVLYYALHRVECPDCGDTLQFMFYSPFKKTRRLSRASCYLCPRCGCETNVAGQKVTADTPPAPFPTLLWALLAVLLLIGVGLVASMIFVGERAPAAAVVAAPPVVPVIALLPQEPAAPRSNNAKPNAADGGA